MELFEQSPIFSIQQHSELNHYAVCLMAQPQQIQPQKVLSSAETGRVGTHSATIFFDQPIDPFFTRPAYPTFLHVCKGQACCPIGQFAI